MRLHIFHRVGVREECGAIRCAAVGIEDRQRRDDRAALRDLTDYVAREPDAADIDEMRAKLIELSSLCARLN